MREHIRATGHEAVRATHESTLEVTTDDYLTPAGDCIVAIAADRAPSDLPSTVVDACQRRDTRIELTIEAGGHTQSIVGRGDPALTFESDRGAVARTSTYVDDRTILVEADTAAADLDRELVAALQAGQSMLATFSVRP